MYWHGDFLGQGSLARLNRHLARAVAATGEIEILPCGEPVPEVELALGLVPRRIEDAEDDALPRVTLRHAWPVHFMHPQVGYSVHMQPWEYGSAPLAWVQRLQDGVDDVWCNSTFVRDSFADSGISPRLLHVVPEGFDPAVYHPGVPPIETGKPGACVFLFVGALLVRKNIPKLLDAYLQAFGPGDDVALLIKRHAGPGMQDDAAAQQLRELAQRTDIPPIRFLEGQYSDADMARLYRTATALVQPYRGEGFCLPVLEAMACGVPVVVTNGGSTDDFVDDEVGYRIPSRRIGLGRNIEGLDLAGEGWWLEASTPALVAALRRIALRRDDAAAKGRAAAQRAHGAWTWDHAARHVVRRIDDLVTTPSVRARTGEDALNDYESKVFSQNGEDGILRELFSRLRVANPFFVEFGAETGEECNAALLARQGWRGVMIEGDPVAFARLRENYRELTEVQTIAAFVSRENVVALFRAANVPTEFDLLSIDVDGNDYHLWEALADYRPRVVVIEFNAAYPPPRRWVMAYNPEHTWRHDDYYGASLASYAALGERLGYSLLGAGSNDVNAFFVRSDLLPHVGFPARSPEAAFHAPRLHFPHRDGPSLEL